MANTLTNLIPLAYASLDVVSRELVGLIPSVNLFAGSDRVAKGQTITSPVAPANTQSDITPAMTVTAASDQTIASKTLAIDNYKTSGFNWTGEEEFGLSTGPGVERLMQDQIEQALRVHVNAIELALATAAHLGASRAYGTAGTTPFASTLGDPAQLKKILDDNGAPFDRSLVMNTSAGAALRTLAQLTKANEAGTDMTLRNGELLNLHGFKLRESAQIVTVGSVGTGASYVLNGAHAVGATAITVKTGTGTVLVGDVITINSQKYVVTAGIASAGTLTIAAPGLQAAGADGNTVTVNAVSARNVGFARSAIQLATRLPKIVSGDLAADRATITDPRSGISFEFAMYPGYRMVKYEVSVAYGSAVVKPEHIAILLG